MSGRVTVRTATAPAVAVLLFALAVAVHLPVLGHGFFLIDDETYVTGNARVADGLTWEGAAWALTSVGYAANWHPLTWVSHMADVELFGMDPRGHHATSLLLHAATAALLFATLRAATGALWPSALAAGVFAAHPAQVESVAWLSERKNLLAGLFWVLALAAHVLRARRPTPARHAAVAALFSLGLLSKPSVVTLPAVLLLVDWWPLGRAGRPGGGPRRQAWTPLVIEKLPLFLLAAAAAALTLVAQSRVGTVAPLAELSVAGRIANAAVSVQHYVGKLLWPDGLSVLYPMPAGGVAAGRAAAAGVLIAAATAVAVWLRARRPNLLAGWGWFLIALAPVAGLVQVGEQAAADRYAYLPGIGLLLMLAWSLPRRGARSGLWAAGALAAALAALVPAARSQVGLWGDEVALLRSSDAAVGRHWRLELLLGIACERAGRLDEAVAAYEGALELMPVLEEAHQRLGRIHLGAGRPAQAERHFAAALRIDPGGATGPLNLGLALAAQGRDGEAVEAFRAAIGRDPGLLPAWGSLAQALARSGLREEARTAYRGALDRFPDSPELRLNAALFLLDEGDAAAAQRHLAEALRLRPGYEAAARALSAAREAGDGSRGHR